LLLPTIEIFWNGLQTSLALACCVGLLHYMVITKLSGLHGGVIEIRITWLAFLIDCDPAEWLASKPDYDYLLWLAYYFDYNIDVLARSLR